MRLNCLLLAAVACVLTTACSAQPAPDKVFGEKVRAYLLEHPEVLEEAIQKLQDKRQADTASKARTALEHSRSAVERDPRDFVANPNGKITVTEFYDYRCPHCINAAPKVLALIKASPDVRFVFKEMPIFGATSEHAARAAIAAKVQGRDVLKFYQALMDTRGLDDAAVDRIAKDQGINLAQAETGQPRAAADAEIADIHKLANDLQIDGTPSFIIGDTIVPGEDMEAVAAAIASARTGAKAG